MHRKIQSGFSLVPALFLLVVLAALGIVAVRLAGVQHQTVVLAMLNGSCAASTLSLSEAGLAGFSVDTNCSSTTHSEGPNTVHVYVIDAFAWSGNYGSPDYVSRRLRSTVTDAS
jgi:MSHA biogenesis protein MshP